MKKLLFAAAAIAALAATTPVFAGDREGIEARGDFKWDVWGQGRGGPGLDWPYYSRGYRTYGHHWRAYGAYGDANCLVRERVETISGRVAYRWHRVC